MSSRSPTPCCDEPWPEPARNRHRKPHSAAPTPSKDGAGTPHSKHRRSGPVARLSQQPVVASHPDRAVSAQCEKCGLIPRRPGERVKTNRRDAQSLARLLRAGELTAVWVPDETHEAVRDLVRTRAMAVEDYRRKRQHVSAFLLRHGRRYDEGELARSAQALA